MRKRVIGCILGGLVGVVAASRLTGDFGISQATALLACSIAGVAVGGGVSVVIDVFLGTKAQSQ